MAPIKPSAPDKIETHDAAIVVQGDNLQGERFQNAEVLRMYEQYAANQRAISEIIANTQFNLNDSGVAHLVLAGFAPQQITDSKNYPLHSKVHELMT